jgi:hypothetical protein
MCREKGYRPGDFVRLKASFQYRLPPGLEVGQVVTLLGTGIGTRQVEDADGKVWTIACHCVDSELEYEISPGVWLDGSHPAVIREKERIARLQRRSEAFGAIMDFWAVTYDAGDPRGWDADTRYVYEERIAILTDGRAPVSPAIDKIARLQAWESIARKIRFTSCLASSAGGN